MFKKTSAHFATLSLSNGLSITNTPDQGITTILAESNYSNLDDLPTFQWETDDQICQSWILISGWGLREACDEAGEQKDFLESDTIGQLKAYAENKEFDGFSIYTGTPTQEWQRLVWYKNCSSVEPDELLLHALVKTNNVDSYMQITHPCS